MSQTLPQKFYVQSDLHISEDTSDGKFSSLSLLYIKTISHFYRLGIIILKVPHLCRFASDTEPNIVRWAILIYDSRNFAETNSLSSHSGVTLDVNVGSQYAFDHEQGREHFYLILIKENHQFFSLDFH